MSQQMRPLIDGWVGYGDGASVLLESGTPINSDHPVCVERPELFEPVTPPAPPAPPVKAAAKKSAAKADG
jgi:hypothetical protein